jgi:alkylation response protein AidB-like acyl-CoA dehydrogenase
MTATSADTPGTAARDAAITGPLEPTGEPASLLPVGPHTPTDEAIAVVRAWVDEHVPATWREAAARGGAAEIRTVRSRADYVAWYPTFGRSGLVAPTWPRDCGGLDLDGATARMIEAELAPYNLGRLNPLGLNLAAPALFAHGTDEQRRRFLPRIVRATEIWCQLFSEPGAGSDLASLSTRAERDGDEWVITGQKVWSTWAHEADFGVLLARTDPSATKRKGITYFLLPLHQDGVDVRPLRHLTGEIDFNEVFLDGARVPDAYRVGDVHDGWRVAGATLSGERQMVSGAGSGGVDRIGGSSATRVLELARTRSAAGLPGGWDDPVMRQRLVALWSEETIRGWTNLRVRAARAANRPIGPESSIGKVIQGRLNQELQAAAVDLLGAEATAWVGPPAGADPPTAAGTTASVDHQPHDHQPHDHQPHDHQPHDHQPHDHQPYVTAAHDQPHDDQPDDQRGGPPSLADRPIDGPAAYAATLPFFVQGMLRSRANTIEGGTTEVNKNILAERVLGLPREPDPWQDAPWTEVPRG